MTKSATPRIAHLPATLPLLPLTLLFLSGCGGSGSSSTSPAPPPTSPAAPLTPSVTLAAAPTGAITTAQSLAVTVTVAAGSTSTPAGSVVLSSGSYASFPVSLTSGQAVVTVPAGLLAAGADTLTASFSPADTTAYNAATGTSAVSVTPSGAALPQVTASPVSYPTVSHPFRALPLSSGDVLVSVTEPLADNTSGSRTGVEVFTPSATGLVSSCTNTLRSSFLADGAGVLGLNLLPNGVGLAVALGVDGALFYDLATLETCNSNGLQVSQGTVASDQGTFDVAVTPDGKFAFVANEYGVAAGAIPEGNVGVIALQYDGNGNLTTGTLIGQISTGGAYIPGVTLSPDGTRLYVTSEVAGNAAAAGGSNPVLTHGGCLQQVGQPATGNGLLTVIDVAKAEATPTSAAILTTVAAGCSPVRTVETADGSTLWLAARGDNRVLAFSTGMLESNPGNALLGYADTGGTAPVGLQLFGKDQLLAVANSNRFDAASGTGTANATILSVAVPASASVVQTIATGSFPREITVGEDDATLYLTNYESNTLEVISTSTH